MAFGNKKTVNASTAVKAPAKAEEKRKPQVLPVVAAPLPTPEDNNPALPVPGTGGKPDGDALAAFARGLGSKETPFMATAQSAIAKGREDWQGGPIMALFSLSLAFSDEEMAAMPNPDHGEDGNNPYKYDVSYMDGDTRKTKASNFCREFVYGSKSGAAYLERIDFVKRAGDKGAIKDGIPEEILEMSPEQRHGEMTFCEGRLKTAEASYKKALLLQHKIAEVKEYAEGIDVTPYWAPGHSPEDHMNDEDVVINPEKVMLDRTNEPLCLTWDLGDNSPRRWEAFSIASFMRLKPAKATEQGGGWRKLIESGVTKKAPKTAGKADKPDDLTIKTPDTSIGVAVELHRYLLEVQGEKDGANWAKLVDMLTKKGNDEYVVTIVELKNIFNDLCRDQKLDLRYAKMKQAGSDLIADAA